MVMSMWPHLFSLPCSRRFCCSCSWITVCWLQLDNSSTYNTNGTSYTSYLASRSVTSACCSTIVFCYLLWNSVTQLFVPTFGSSLLSDLSIDRLIYSLIHSWATLFIHLFTGWLPSVIWHCWLGGRKGIRPVKKLSDEVLAWLSVCSEVQIVCL